MLAARLRAWQGPWVARRATAAAGVGRCGAAHAPTPPRLVVLDSDTLALGEDAWQPFDALGSLQVHGSTPHGEPRTIVDRCSGAQVVITKKVPLRAETLSRLPDLRLIQVLSTGVNVVDVAAAKAQGVTVCNGSGYSTRSTAQHAVALALELCHRVALHDASVRAGDWARSPHFWFKKSDLVELEGLTVGLLGLGAIGRRVGELLRAFGVGRLLAWTPSRRDPPAWPEFAWASSVEELFEQSDILSLHCPLSAATERIVGPETLRRMKPSALLVNTARGGLVDEAALAEALAAGRIAGAAVDVVQEEPMSEARPSPLLRAPNCVITPHMGWSSLQSRTRLLHIAETNVARFLAGQPVDAVGGDRHGATGPSVPGFGVFADGDHRGVLQPADQAAGAILVGSGANLITMPLAALGGGASQRRTAADSGGQEDGYKNEKSRAQRRTATEKAEVRGQGSWASYRPSGPRQGLEAF